jgi:hypothetical protein
MSATPSGASDANGSQRFHNARASVGTSWFSSHNSARTVLMNALSVSGDFFAAMNSVAIEPHAR